MRAIPPTAHRTAAITHVIAAIFFGAAGAGCKTSTRSIGAVCPGPDGGTPIDASCGGGSDAPAGTTLAVGLDQSGVSLLETGLTVGGATLPPVLRLRGERATATGWPAESGATLAPAGGAFELGLGAPFTDATRAVGLGAGIAFVAADPAVGAVGADDFALEIVLRAASAVEIADKQVGATGWSLSSRATGELELFARDAAGNAVDVISPPLPPGSWAHCVFWVSRAAGGRADCDGRAGTPAAVPASLGTLDSGAMLALGGGATRVAFLALYRAAPGGLGAAAGWRVASARRFAALTGARPSVARGTALPAPGLRDSLAYLDLQAAAGAPRRLFLVGADWPRVVCRTDAAGARACGFLSEPRRARGVPAAAHDWTARELAVVARQARLADDGPAFEALVPSATAGVHALALVRDEIVASQTFSFFARAGTSTRVGVVAGTRGLAVFDVSAGAVIAAPAGLRATIEPWGDGIFRCALAFEGGQKAAELGIHLLDAAGAETLAGDGAAAAVEVAGLQLDVGLVFAGSLQAADVQLADRLTFVGDDGNLPVGNAAAIGLRVLLPQGARLTDQAILNLNRDGTFENQVQLFVRGDQGVTKFWGLKNGDTYWTFDHPTSVVDGVVHRLQVGWDATTAHVDLDGVPRVEPVQLPNDAPFLLNRIDVGFSAVSSGALEGLVGGLTIGAPR